VTVDPQISSDSLIGLRGDRGHRFASGITLLALRLIRYLLRGATSGARGGIVEGIITIVRQVANEPPRGRPDPFDDELPGG
jgi:hypothetical protein